MKAHTPANCYKRMRHTVPNRMPEDQLRVVPCCEYSIAIQDNLVMVKHYQKSQQFVSKSVSLFAQWKILTNALLNKKLLYPVMLETFESCASNVLTCSIQSDLVGDQTPFITCSKHTSVVMATLCFHHTYGKYNC